MATGLHGLPGLHVQPNVRRGEAVHARAHLQATEDSTASKALELKITPNAVEDNAVVGWNQGWERSPLRARQ